MAFLTLCALTLALPASAAVLISINKSTQRMTVSVDGVARHTFLVSTGRTGYGTPSGTFRPQWMARTWFSRKYYNSPMPHSIFFRRGYAIHGSYEIRRLGGVASHGCVRLHPGNAAALFALVQRHGMGATKIVVHGANPRGAVPRAPRAHPVYRAPRAYPVYEVYPYPTYQAPRSTFPFVVAPY